MGAEDKAWLCGEAAGQQVGGGLGRFGCGWWPGEGKCTTTCQLSSSPSAFGLFESFKRGNELSWNKIGGWALEGDGGPSGGEQPLLPGPLRQVRTSFGSAQAGPTFSPLGGARCRAAAGRAALTNASLCPRPEPHTVGYSQSSLIHLVGPSDCTLLGFVHGGERRGPVTAGLVCPAAEARFESSRCASVFSGDGLCR